jgi:hypothetical protein
MIFKQGNVRKQGSRIGILFKLCILKLTKVHKPPFTIGHDVNIAIALHRKSFPVYRLPYNKLGCFRISFPYADIIAIGRYVFPCAFLGRGKLAIPGFLPPIRVIESLKHSASNKKGGE